MPAHEKQTLRRTTANRVTEGRVSFITDKPRDFPEWRHNAPRALELNEILLNGDAYAKEIDGKQARVRAEKIAKGAIVETATSPEGRTEGDFGQEPKDDVNPDDIPF